jgi:hypothetical protein
MPERHAETLAWLRSEREANGITLVNLADRLEFATHHPVLDLELGNLRTKVDQRIDRYKSALLEVARERRARLDETIAALTTGRA